MAPSPVQRPYRARGLYRGLMKSAAGSLTVGRTPARRRGLEVDGLGQRAARSRRGLRLRRSARAAVERERSADSPAVSGAPYGRSRPKGATGRVAAPDRYGRGVPRLHFLSVAARSTAATGSAACP
ncbi:hypothetical protein, partial [Streptomyces sp. MnatMP-M17]|uniref:hypothetical protein n=1 Tax=Streptomyces sp. MnatMP-M17 TaxID=1839780 RepID=UPI001C405992